MKKMLGLILPPLFILGFIFFAIWVILKPPVHENSVDVEVIGFYHNDKITYVLESDNGFSFSTTSGFQNVKYTTNDNVFGKIYSEIVYECGDRIYMNTHYIHKGFRSDWTYTLYSQDYCN